MLPPLEPPEFASVQLLRGLRDCVGTSLSSAPGFGLPDGARSIPAPGARCRTAGGSCLMTTSDFGLRANECLAGVDVDPAGVTTSTGAGVGDGIAGGAANSTRELAASFEGLVKSVEAALSGQEGGIQLLRRGEEVRDTVPLRGTRHYRVALPLRPTAITASVTRTSGGAVTLWGSTSCSRPHARDHDIKGKDDETIVYRHALSCASIDGEIDLVDRRKSVPPCRDFYLTVAGTKAASSYSLTVTFEPIKIVRTRLEIHWERQLTNMTWEARIREIKRDPAKKDQFMDRVRDIEHDHKVRCLRRLSDKNFLQLNRQASSEALPKCKEARRQKKVLKFYAHLDAVQERKSHLEKERETRQAERLYAGGEGRGEASPRPSLPLLGAVIEAASASGTPIPTALEGGA